MPLLKRTLQILVAHQAIAQLFTHVI